MLCQQELPVAQFAGKRDASRLVQRCLACRGQVAGAVSHCSPALTYGPSLTLQLQRDQSNAAVAMMRDIARGKRPLDDSVDDGAADDVPPAPKRRNVTHAVLAERYHTGGAVAGDSAAIATARQELARIQRGITDYGGGTTKNRARRPTLTRWYVVKPKIGMWTAMTPTTAMKPTMTTRYRAPTPTPRQYSRRNVAGPASSLSPMQMARLAPAMDLAKSLTRPPMPVLPVHAAGPAYVLFPIQMPLAVRPAVLAKNLLLLLLSQLAVDGHQKRDGRSAVLAKIELTTRPATLTNLLRLLRRKTRCNSRPYLKRTWVLSGSLMQGWRRRRCATAQDVRSGGLMWCLWTMGFASAVI